jgi:hypothetical protein
VDLAKKLGIAGDRERQGGNPAKERHPRRAVLFDQGSHPGREVVDGPGVYTHVIPLPVSNRAIGCHSIALQFVFQDYTMALPGGRERDR